MDIENVFEELFAHFDVSTIRDLSKKIDMSESTVSKWGQRNSINAIKKKCRELKIYDEIFGTTNTQEISKNTRDIELENKSDLSKYFTALQSVAIATNKEDELILDIRELIKKYMQ